MPHQQIRMVIPGSSPPDIVGPLKILADAGIVLTSAGGSNIEHHGEFAVSIEDDEDDKKVQRAMDLLKGFHPHIAEVKVCWLVPGASGQLLACIEEARNEDRFAGLRVRDVAITTERNNQGEVAVQVFFEGRR